MYWCIDALRMQIVRKSKKLNNYEIFYVKAAGRMHGLKYGSCRFWQRTDSPRAQTCCALKSSAPSGARQDTCADVLGLQTRRSSNHSAAHVGESNSRSNIFQIRRATACVPRRWKVLSGEFRRRPTEFVIKLRNPYRVGRRGLSEPREGLSRLRTCAIPWLDSVAVSVAVSVELQLACPDVGKFSRASSAGGRRNL